MNKKPSWIARKIVYIFILIYFFISAIFIYKNINENKLILMDISNYSTHEVVYSENIIDVLSIITTIGSLLATISISTATLLLSRTNIKLFDYMKLVANKDGALLLIGIIFLNLIISLFIIYQPHTILIDIWLKISIFPSIMFFIVLIKNFEIVDKEEKMKEHLLFLLNNKKRKNVIDFLLQITNNSFKKEFYSILFYIMENAKTTDKEYLLLINKDIIEKKDDVDIDYILKIQSIIVPLANDPLFKELQEKYLDIAFSEYKKKIFREIINYNNFIMRVKSHLYTNILFNEKLNIEQEKILLQKYLILMRRSYELVIIILSKNNLNNTRETINDFLGIVQFFNVNKIVNRNDDIIINKKYNYYLVGILCWILNRIIIINLNGEYINIIKTLFTRINEIDLSGPEDDMFEEIITDITFHEIRYTRTFFIALSLIFLEESEINEVLDKIYYNKIYSNNHFLFKRIIDTFKDITIQERRALNISQEEFNDKAKIIIKIIEKKIKSIIQKQNKSIASVEINMEILNNEKEKIQSELKFLTNVNHEKFTDYCLNFNSKIPRRYLIGDQSIILLGKNVYKTSILLFFYKNYIKYCENIKISRISEIPKDNITLIMPANLNDYFFIQNEYNYNNDGIEIDGKYYPIIWIQDRGPIITLEDLINFIHLPPNAVSIETGEDEEQDGELFTNCKININYCRNNNLTKQTGYSIL